MNASIYLQVLDINEKDRIEKKLKEVRNDLPSQRIKIGLKNTKEFEERDNCGIDLKYYHRRDGELYFADFAGASAIQRLGIDPSWFERDDKDIPELNDFELSLYHAKKGNILEMVYVMNKYRKNKLSLEHYGKFSRNIPNYYKYEEFYKKMNQLVNDLEQGGY